METLNNILQLLREQGKKQKDLMEFLGISKNVFTDWKSGRNSSYLKHLPRIAGYLGTSVDALLGTPPAARVHIPVRGEVAAGLPIEAVEDILDYEEIDAHMASLGEHMALRLRGDSMEPRMRSGDVVIVRMQEDVDSGDVAVVMVGAEATVKKVRKSPDGIMLVPYNTLYEPMFYNNAQIEEMPVRILGKVVELRAKF